MDVVKICEVVDGCGDCPKYGDDCDGDKMTEHTDLISRADAIEAVGYEIDDGYNAIVDRINALPSADAVQGEWQKVEEQPYFRKHYDTVCCSVCRKKGNRKWNFCPNCGARMKGGEDE